jgi:hypothetical protein
MSAPGTAISEMPLLLQDSNDESVLLSKVASRALRIAVLGLGHAGLPTPLGFAASASPMKGKTTVDAVDEMSRYLNVRGIDTC